MLSREEKSHENFQELCALAVIGELSQEELSDLEAHISLCVSCRIASSDYMDLLHGKLPLARPRSKAALRFQIPMRASGYRRRFIAEAEKRGFHFSEAT